MSIKIYDGFKLSGLSPVQLMACLNDFKAECEKYATENGRDRYLNALLRYYDKHAFQAESPPVGRSDFDDGLMKSILKNGIEPQSTEFDNIYRNNLNYGCELTLGAVSDTEWLCMPFFECHDLYWRLETLPGYERYGYWNNSDRPDGVSEEQWAKRRDDWVSIMEPTWTPSHAMLSRQIIPNDFIRRFMWESYSTLSEERIAEANKYRYGVLLKSACAKAYQLEHKDDIEGMPYGKLRKAFEAKFADESWEARITAHGAILAHIESHPVTSIVRH